MGPQQIKTFPTLERVESARESPWSSVIMAACVCATLALLGYAILDWPLLTPEKFWSSSHGDQGIIAVFMLKKYGYASFSRDFHFTVNPNAIRLYNPLNIWLLSQTYRLGGHSVPAAYFLLLVPFIFLYVCSMYLVIFQFTRSHLVSGFVSLISTQQIGLAFFADGWGIGTIQTSRAAYYVLPFVAVGLFLAVKSYASEKLGWVFLSSVLIGLSSVLHPVTGYHLIAIFSVA